MTTEELLDRIQDSRSRIAIFRRAAFHVHTPDSYDWGARPNADRDYNGREQFFAEGGAELYIDKLKPHFDIVGITDHMKSGYATRLAEKTNPEELLVIPGMEVSCRMRTGGGTIHILVLFPPGTSSDQIERIFSDSPTLPPERTRVGQERIEIEDWDSFQEKVKGLGGITIFAHIGSDAGHRHVLREAIGKALLAFQLNDRLEETQEAEVAEIYAEELARLKPTAIEVLKPGDSKHFTSYKYDGDRKEAGFPCVMRSDFHCIEDLGRPECVTYIKTSALNFDSVKEAIRFYPTRVRFQSDLPVIPNPVLIGLSLIPGESNNRLSEIDAAFSPNLNCLIGPRGSGKTTVIEAIRLVTGNNLDFQYWAEQNPKQVAEEIQKGNLADTTVRLLYRDSDDQLYRVEAHFQDVKSDPIFRLYNAVDAEIQITESALRQKLKCRIFSWSQLESLGRNKDDQRELTDTFNPDIQDHKSRLEPIRTLLAENKDAISAKARELERTFNERNGLIERYAEHKSEYESLNTPRMGELFATLDDLTQKKAALDKMISDREQMTIRLEAQSQSDAAEPELADGLLTDDQRTWLEESLRELPGITAELAAHSHAREALINAIATQIAALKSKTSILVAQVDDANTTIRQELTQNPDQEISSRQRTEAKRRFEEVQEIRNRYLETLTEFNSAIAVRESLLNDLATSIQELRELRIQNTGMLGEQMSSVLPADLSISVAVQDTANRTRLTEYLKSDFLKRENAGNYNNTQFASRLVAMVSGQHFGTYLLQVDPTTMTGSQSKPGQDRVLTESELHKLFECQKYKQTNEGAAVDRVNLENLEKALTIQTMEDEDSVVISLNGKPIDEVSPGQRCSALLPLVALSDDCPLIIDQPEDNLDNRLIGSVMTNVLARLKENRQILISTHNANMVVSGDAEQVIVFEQNEGRCEKADDGSIDSPAIVKAVLGIMEGGREAFDARNSRYGNMQG